MFVTPSLLGAIIDYTSIVVAFALVGGFYAGSAAILVVLKLRDGRSIDSGDPAGEESETML